MSTLRRVVLVFVLLAASAVGAAAATTLRISLPPVLEALPIALAEAWGMFDAEGLSVVVEGFGESQDRSTALLTDNLDAIMSDVTSAILADAPSLSLVTVAAAGSTPQPEAHRVVLASYAGFGPSDMESLLGSSDRVGVIEKSDEEYLLDQFFAAHGQPRAWQIRYWYPLSLNQLAGYLSWQSGPPRSGVLPEPYYSYISAFIQPSGVQAQMVVLTDFSDLVVLPRVLVFRKDFVNKHRAEVAAFLRVYAAAVERMNVTPRDEIINVGLDAVISLFFPGADKTTVQPQTLDAMSIPVFERPAPLPEEIFDSVTEWMHHRGYLDDAAAPSFVEFGDFTLLP